MSKENKKFTYTNFPHISFLKSLRALQAAQIQYGPGNGTDIFYFTLLDYKFEDLRIF